MVGLKPNSFLMNYGSRQGPLQMTRTTTTDLAEWLGRHGLALLWQILLTPAFACRSRFGSTDTVEGLIE